MHSGYFLKILLIHQRLHVIFSAKSSDLLMEEYRKETINRLITVLVEYIFKED